MYKCLGKRLFVKDERARLATKLDRLHEQMDTVDETVRAPYQRKVKKLKAELAQFDGLADDNYLGRAGCGYDLIDQINAIEARFLDQGTWPESGRINVPLVLD